ncbi:MAG: hypothetical protein QNJ37_12065 [Crocosphaera sp.]|nr:hypothetical protein [Crocosphaera sp.]
MENSMALLKEIFGGDNSMNSLTLATALYQKSGGQTIAEGYKLMNLFIHQCILRKGNLAYRRLLEEDFSDISKERLEEISIQYELDNNDLQKIISSLQKLFEIKQEIKTSMRNTFID